MDTNGNTCAQEGGGEATCRYNIFSGFFGCTIGSGVKSLPRMMQGVVRWELVISQDGLFLKSTPPLWTRMGYAAQVERRRRAVSCNRERSNQADVAVAR